MRGHKSILMVPVLVVIAIATLQAQRGRNPQPAADDPVKTLAGRLELEKYKATLKGLAQFGDRRQGTERNRKAVDWIEAQLKSYGCPTERIKYEYNPNPQRGGGAGGDAEGARGDAGQRGQGARGEGQRGAATDAQRGRGATGQGGVGRSAKVIASGEIVAGQGGSRVYGVSAATGVNNDGNRQPDARLRELNREQTTNGPREEVY